MVPYLFSKGKNMKIIINNDFKQKQIKLHDIYEVCFTYMHGDADGYTTNVVLLTKNMMDIYAAIYIFHSYKNLYPRGRGCRDDYPVIWEDIHEDWPYDDCDIQTSLDGCNVYYYDNGVRLKTDVEYDLEDTAFIKSFGDMNTVAGGRTNNRTHAINDYDWSTYRKRILEYVNIKHNNCLDSVTIFG